MNDYSQGALEALAWARNRLASCGDVGQFQDALADIDERLIAMTYGAGQNFKDKSDFLLKEKPKG